MIARILIRVFNTYSYFSLATLSPMLHDILLENYASKNNNGRKLRSLKLFIANNWFIDD
jgi:hypothetical protein